MRAESTKIPPFLCPKQTVPQTDEPQDGWDVNALHEGEQARIATQVVAKRIEGAKALFGLLDKLGIGLETAETHGVVDTHASQLSQLAPQAVARVTTTSALSLSRHLNTTASCVMNPSPFPAAFPAVYPEAFPG